MSNDVTDALEVNDLLAFNRWAHLDRLSLREYVLEFLNSAQADMTKVEAALACNDRAALNFWGHHIGGAAAVVGLGKFSILCRRLGSSEGQSIGQLRDIVDQIHLMIVHIRAQFE